MKLTKWLALYSLFIFGYISNANAEKSMDPRVVGQCSTARVLTQIRPGAAWVMQGDSVQKLKWLDTKQKKPSAAEVEKAKQACMADAQSREALKAQARLEVKNPNVPVEKKVQDLILLLDMDR